MGLFKWANDRVKKMSFFDVKLVAIAGFFIGLILVKLAPSILNISGWWFVAIVVLCLLRIYYVILFKKN